MSDFLVFKQDINLPSLIDTLCGRNPGLFISPISMRTYDSAYCLTIRNAGHGRYRFSMCNSLLNPNFPTPYVVDALFKTYFSAGGERDIHVIREELLRRRSVMMRYMVPGADINAASGVGGIPQRNPPPIDASTWAHATAGNGEVPF